MTDFCVPEQLAQADGVLTSRRLESAYAVTYRPTLAQAGIGQPVEIPLPLSHLAGNEFAMTTLFAAGYKVPPGKDMTEPDARAAVEGSELQLRGPLAARVQELIAKRVSHPIDIAFPSTNQQHPIRTLVLTIARVRRAEPAARELAVRLTMTTDNRSKLGLLLVVVTTAPRQQRSVYLWRFGVEQNLIAQFRQGHLDVEVLDEAFAAESILFKAARFTGAAEAEGGFWTGRAEDHQAKLPGSAASAYWIEDFLKAKLAVSPGQGTQVLAQAIETVARRVVDSQLQTRLITGALSLFNAAGDRVTFEDAADRLPADLREDVLREVDKAYSRTATFTLDEETLSRDLGMREVRLDTGVIVAGPNQTFDRVVHRNELANARVELRTTGEIVGTRVKRRRTQAG